MVGITRQTAILAFNFGDGFCNYILPMSTALMGKLKCCKYFLTIVGCALCGKIMLLWLAVGSALVFIAQMIHLGPHVNGKYIKNNFLIFPLYVSNFEKNVKEPSLLFDVFLSTI